MTLPLTGLALFVVAIAIASGAIVWLRRHAPRLGLIDAPGGRKDHANATPLVGGLGIMAAVAVPAFGGLVLALFGPRLLPSLPESVGVHLPGILLRAKELLAILAGSVVMMGLGYLDDRRGLPAWSRLLVQLGAAGLLVVVGVRVTVFLSNPWLQAALTVLFVAFLTNAVNFIDNMNGLSSGTVLIAATHLLALAVAMGQLFLAAILLCLIGGLVAFLPRNFPRATVFLGDAGSMALGFLMAGVTIVFTFTEGDASPKPILLPLLFLAIPVADGATVIVARLVRGVHPFTAGHDHLSHRLVRRGLSRERAVMTLWGVGFLTGAVATTLGGTPPIVSLVVWSGVVIGLALVGATVRSRELGS